MRRFIALYLLPVLAVAGSASAETWKAYSALGANNLQWSYDADYSHIDPATKRVVVMQAIGKSGATPRVGPSGPGAPDGVGTVWALDCKAADMIVLANYAPSKPLMIPSDWRSSSPKKIEKPDDKALLTAVCAGAAKLPVR